MILYHKLFKEYPTEYTSYVNTSKKSFKRLARTQTVTTKDGKRKTIKHFKCV